MTPEDAKSALGDRYPTKVRCFYDSDRDMTYLDEGTLIAFTSEPTVTVLLPDGSATTWLARLTEEIPRPEETQ